MRQQTANSFSEGLSYDLNPLMTPNSMLTDCVNGTLLTFNGDELALQNDSGNTQITILYPTAIEYNSENYYNNGVIVYTENEGSKTYYKNISGDINDDSSLNNTSS
jgi:hypothetical protein